MEMYSEDFMKLTIQDVSDLLLEDLTKNNKRESGALLTGVDETGRRYRLTVRLSL